MGLAETICDILTVPAAIGGIHTYSDTARSGFNRTTYPTVFDTNGLIKPCIFVDERSRINIQDLMGDGIASMRSVVEIWFFAHSSYGAIDTMRDSVFDQLHEVQVAGTFQVLWSNDVRVEHDEDIDALIERSDYWVFLTKGT